MSLGTRIKKRRKEMKMTQSELAEKIASTKQTVYKYENDLITNIPYDKLTIISSVLDTTPSQLMGWDSVAENIGRQAADEYLQTLCTSDDYQDESDRKHTKKLLEYYHLLNDEGQKEAVIRIEELTQLDKFRI